MPAFPKIIKNRALIRDVFKILMIFKIIFDIMKMSKLRSRAERLQKFDDTLKKYIFIRDVFKNSSIYFLKDQILEKRF